MSLPTVVFLGSNPSDTTRIRLVAEVRKIQGRAARVGEVFRVAAEFAVHPNDLRSLLLFHAPAMLHFLENDQGVAVAVQSDVLAELLALAKRDAPLRCVLLNACFTASQAQGIAENVDCVIGTTREIDDHAAIAFATGFYRAIAFGESIGTAFELGRNQVELYGSSSYDAFRLFHRPQVEPRRVFLDGPNASPREFLPSDESPVASSSPDAGEDYALVNGVNHYPQLRPLRGAIADAEAFIYNSPHRQRDFADLEFP